MTDLDIMIEVREWLASRPAALMQDADWITLGRAIEARANLASEQCVNCGLPVYPQCNCERGRAAKANLASGQSGEKRREKCPNCGLSVNPLCNCERGRALKG